MTDTTVLPRLPEIDSALQTLSEILQQLTNQKSSIEDDIHATFDELQKTLNVRKSVLLMELEVNYGLKQKVGWKSWTHWGLGLIVAPSVRSVSTLFYYNLFNRKLLKNTLDCVWCVVKVQRDRRWRRCSSSVPTANQPAPFKACELCHMGCKWFTTDWLLCSQNTGVWGLTWE